MTTNQALAHIQREKSRRWMKGRETYRNDPNDPFVGDPIEEMLEELLDALNYLDVIAENKSMEPWMISSLHHNVLQSAVFLLTSERL